MKRRILATICGMAVFTSFADTQIETFTTNDGSNTKTYETAPVSKTCDQSTWTVFRGGITKNQGKMGADNFIAIIRGTKPEETGHAYLISDSIECGIDSLYFDWNSNGDNESHNREWKIRISINGDSIGGIYEPIGEYKSGAPFYRYAIGNLKREGKFVLKIENLSDYKAGESGNCYRFVIDNLSWTTYTPQATDIKEEARNHATVTYDNSSYRIRTETDAASFIVQVCDQLGHIVLHTTNNPDIDIARLPHGLYIINAIFDNDNRTKRTYKIIKH